MKKNEKRNILILLALSIIIILLENVLVQNINKNEIEEAILENEKLLGITDVSGEGIIINIQDGSDLIHQEDMVILLDELKNAGAEAISINEQRIIKDTYIYCDGSVILIDGIKIGNPFQIKAIGNSETIYGAITRNKGYISILTKDGIKINIEKNDEVKILKTNKKIFNKLKETKNLSKRLKMTNKLVGKTDVRGSGIEIVIDTSNTSDITALSLLQLVNDLNSAGAEAISINGNRIVNMTDMMDINKEYILIDSNCVSSPYIIKAIGNVQKLNETMELENSTFSKLKRNGKDIVKKSKMFIFINKYTVTKGQDKLILKYIK